MIEERIRVICYVLAKSRQSRGLKHKLSGVISLNFTCLNAQQSGIPKCKKNRNKHDRETIPFFKQQWNKMFHSILRFPCAGKNVKKLIYNLCINLCTFQRSTAINMFVLVRRQQDFNNGVQLGGEHSFIFNLDI